MEEGCKDVGLLGMSKDETSRVKLTEVNPHLVCVLCHGYFVDATTITECLHSFCRSCIFRHLEIKSFCPICEVQVHARLHRSLKPDKTLQDIVYKLVPGLFHNEMERRRAFYKQYPFRDEHLEPERRGLGLDRLIYSPTDTISLSLEFYDAEREREEWSSVTCPPPHPQETPISNSSNNNNKRYLQCPAIFKMAHLKKFLRQKYNLHPTANVEIIYKREFLPDSYSLMDVAYIYTWKRNGPMRFYYRIPDVVEKEMPFDGKTIQEKTDVKAKSTSKVTPVDSASSSSPTSDLERNKKVLSAANLPVETEEKKITPVALNSVKDILLNDIDLEAEPVPPKTSKIPSKIESDENHVQEKKEEKQDDITAPITSCEKTNNVPDSNSDKSITNLTENNETTSKIPASVPVVAKITTETKCSEENKVSTPLNVPKVSKQDELPVEVLLSLSTCRVGKEVTANVSESKQNSTVVPESNQAQVPKTNPNIVPKPKHSSNARMSLTKIANELQQKAANNLNQKNSKENASSPTKNSVPNKITSPNAKIAGQIKNGNVGNNVNGRLNGNKRKSNGAVTHGRHFFNDVGVMDHRIQQLYKYPGGPAGNGVAPVGQKTESRLASWLNNRFQAKPPGSPSHPGISATSSLGNALSTHLNLTPKLNGATKPVEEIAPTGVNTALQNAISTINKNSSPNTNSAVGFYNKNHILKSPLPVNPAPTSVLPNGKRHSSEKRNKLKLPLQVPNGVIGKKELSKEMLTNSPASKPNNTIASNISPKLSSPKKEDIIKNNKLLHKLMTTPSQLAASFVKDQGLILPEAASAKVIPKEMIPPVPASPDTSTPVNKTSPPAQKDKELNGEKVNTVPSVKNGPESTSVSQDVKVDSSVKISETKGGLDEEVNRLKKKLEEMRKMSNVKGKELGGCRITHENPDPEEAKKRRDLTPVVSIELMRGCKRPVPGLKAIQDISDIGKRKGQEDKKEPLEKKLKLSSSKKEITKKEESSCALDLSRCGPPNQATSPHPWFNPLLHQQFLPSPK